MRFRHRISSRGGQVGVGSRSSRCLIPLILLCGIFLGNRLFWIKWSQHDSRILFNVADSTVMPFRKGATQIAFDKSTTRSDVTVRELTEVGATKRLTNPAVTEPIRPEQRFEGTKLIPLSPGMDVLENVCIVKGGARELNKLISFTEHAEQLKTSVYNYMQPSWSAWTTVTVGRSLSEWDNMTQQYPLFRNETLLTLEIWENPGHCLNDLAFSIALDVSHRHLHDNGNNGPLYPQYVASFFKGLASSHGENNKVPSWCFSFLHDAGFLDTSKGPVFDDSPGLCFERLLVPLIAVHRFPIDWKDAKAIEDVYAANVQDLKGRKPSTGEGNLYPAEALVRLHDKVIQSKNFTSEPWPEVSSDEIQQEEVPIFLYTREGVRRRRWTNADEVKATLELNYRVKVQIIGAEWLTMSPQQQASLYNNNSRIISVHGAHLANLFYSRNKTRIVEIRCGRAKPEAKLSLLRPPNHSSRIQPSDWYGHLGWFSSATRRMGIEHFVFAEHSAAHQAVVSFNTTNSLLIPFLVSRLKLEPRIGTHDSL